MGRNSFQETLQLLKKQFQYWWKPVTIQMQFGELIQTRELIFGIKILSIMNTLLLMNSILVYIRNLKACFQRYVSDSDHLPIIKILCLGNGKNWERDMHKIWTENHKWSPGTGFIDCFSKKLISQVSNLFSSTNGCNCEAELRGIWFYRTSLKLDS